MQSPTRSVILLAMFIAATFSARADDASVRREYDKIKAELKTESITEASKNNADMRRLYLKYAKQLESLGYSDPGEFATGCLIEGADLYQQGNDTTSASRLLRSADSKAKAWPNRLYLIQVAMRNPGDRSFSDRLLKGAIGDAEKDPAKARDLVPVLRQAGMEKDAAQLEEKANAAAPSPGKSKSIVIGGAKSGGGGKSGGKTKSGGRAPIAFQAKSFQTGESISLDKYRGKVVLLDFWATWCGPCVGELPNVKKTYDAFRGKEFEIIGISLDNDLNQLATFLKSQNMRWPQIADGGGWNSALAKLYKVNSIPHTLLIGRDGMVIAENLRGQELYDAVSNAVAQH